MQRIYNFSAGPSMLPVSVLEKASAEIADYNGCGQSIMEMSHRSKEFEAIIQESENLMRELYKVPNHYKILFLQGGASAQFSAVPLNFMNKSGKADYIITGQWAKKAFEEAKKYGDVKAVASSEDKAFSYIPKTTENTFRKDADYVHICMNNTIYGTVYKELPPVNDKPLIADISSCALSQPLDISKFGVVYFGAQKNLAPAGLVIVIIREDLLGNTRDITPTMMNYTIQAKANSLYNTPPCWNIYICKLVMQWIKSEFTNLDNLKIHNEIKAEVLYDFLDQSKMFHATAAVGDRSIMNIPFVATNEYMNRKFIEDAEKAGLVNLKGHRTVGGMRASLYNAMPIDGVKKLVEFTKHFERENS